jgi:hypothetical protein
MIEKGRFLIIFIVICNLCLVPGKTDYQRPSEDQRVRLWREHNVWPPDWQEESEGIFTCIYIHTHIHAFKYKYMFKHRRICTYTCLNKYA